MFPTMGRNLEDLVVFKQGFVELMIFLPCNASHLLAVQLYSQMKQISAYFIFVNLVNAVY
jgi:hypothetical protein